jgi:hypothetical protein
VRSVDLSMCDIGMKVTMKSYEGLQHWASKAGLNDLTQWIIEA